MRFLIAIEAGDKQHAWGVTVPDLPGCFSAGDTLDEAMDQAREAILLHMQGMLDDEHPVPVPQTIDTYRNRREYKDRIWALIDVNETGSPA